MRERKPGDLILGLKIHTNAIGWALLREPGRKGEHTRGALDVGERDPAEAALRFARAKKAEEVTLNSYATSAALDRSEHARGMTLGDHHALVERTRELLEANNIRVIIKVVK